MPSNITRGNVEGLIAVVLNMSPSSVSFYNTSEKTYIIPGIMSTDIPINLIPPSIVSGISIGNLRVPANNSLCVQFSNCSNGSLSPPSGLYTLILSRPSNASILPTVSF
jgi:hypothetical protein